MQPTLTPKQAVSMISKFKNHPEEYCKFMWPEDKLWGKQVDMFQSVVKNRDTFVKSCNSSGKTYGVGRLVPWFLCCFQPAQVITTAPSWTQVEKQIWGEVGKAYNTARIKLPGTMLTTDWKIGRDHYGIGLSTNEKEKFQGFHAPNILVLFDEASGVRPVIWGRRHSILTSPFSRFLAVGNPLTPSGDFFNAFRVPGPNKITITAYEAVKAGIPGLVTQAWIDEQEKLRDEGINPFFEPQVLGEFPTLAIDSVLSLADIEKAIASPNRVSGYQHVVVACDPAFQGDDECVIQTWSNLRLKNQQIFPKMEEMEVAAEIAATFIREGADLIVLDEDGAGHGVGSALRKQGYGKKLLSIHGASTKDVQPGYYNKRTQIHMEVAKLFRKGIVGIPGNLEKLKEQLMMPKYFRHLSGRILIISKKEIKKLHGQSPDQGDCCFYGVFAQMYLEGMTKEEEETNLYKWWEEAVEVSQEDAVLGIRSSEE